MKRKPRSQVRQEKMEHASFTGEYKEFQEIDELLEYDRSLLIVEVPRPPKK